MPVIIIAVRATGPQAVITNHHVKPAFGKARADDAVRRKAEALHAAGIDLHVCSADEKRIHPGLAQMVPHCPLADTQRDTIPCRAMRTDITAGIERHP